MPDDSGIVTLFIIALGACLGSFITAVSYRIPKGEDFIYKPSYCTKCHHSLEAVDLIPIFSWIFSRGACRYCKSKISLRYPMIEIISAIATYNVYIAHGISIDGFLMMLTTVCLLALLTIHMEKKTVPKLIISSLFILAIVRWGSFEYLYISEMIWGVILALFMSFIFQRILLISNWHKYTLLSFTDFMILLAAGVYLGALWYIPFFMLAATLSVVFGKAFIRQTGTRYNFSTIAIVVCLFFFLL